MAYDIFSLGYDKDLNRGEVSSLDVPTNPVTTEDTGVYTGGITSNPTEDVINPTSVSSGSLASLLYVGKQTFTDTTAGYRMGIDSDGVYKWIIGDGTSSVDWAVTTAATLTIKGAGLVSPTISYGKTSFSDSTNAGYWIGSSGLYVGSAADATKLKFTIADGSFDLVGTVSSRSTATLAATINSTGNVITDLINARISTSAKTILSDFTFGSSDFAGAVKCGTITWNATTGAITGGSGGVFHKGGILFANAGVATITLDATTGNATFAGTLSAAAGTLGSITAGTFTGCTFQTDTGATAGIKMDSTSVRGYDGSNNKTFELVRTTGILSVTGGIIDGTSTLGGRTGTALATAINASSNLVTDLINVRLDTSAKNILSDFAFGSADYAGALKCGTVTWNASTGAITGGSGGVFHKGGIVFANTGVATITLDAATGNATFAGTLSGASGTFGTITSGAMTGVTMSIGTSNAIFKADANGIYLGHATFASAPFSVSMAGAVVMTSATITGGSVKYGKTGFTDSTNAGYYFGSEGLYFGAASDASKLKYTIADGTFDFIGTVSSRSTVTIAATIDVSGNILTDITNARLNSSTKAILADFNFGSTNYAGAVKTGDITWNTTTGAITGGSGVVVYRGGIVGAAAGVATFSIDATTGAAIFAGSLSSPLGNIGGFTIGATTLSATSGGNTTTISSGSTAFSAGPTATPSVTITQAGVLTATGATLTSINLYATGVAGGNITSGNSLYMKPETDVPLVAGTGADSNAVGTITWSNPTRIQADDGSYAEAILNYDTDSISDAVSHYVKGTNFGFAIPSNATINGIKLSIKRYGNIHYTVIDWVNDSSVKIVKADGSIGTTNKASATHWPEGVGAVSVATYGGLLDYWGETWTPTDINDADFGAVLSANLHANGGGSYAGADVDYFKIDVWYYIDGEVWKASSSVSTNPGRFVGIAQETKTTGQTIKYVRPGNRVTGLTGLIRNSYYYLQNTVGTLATTPPTGANVTARVGFALNETEMLVIQPRFMVRGTQAIGSATTYAQTCGFYPAKIDVYAGVAGGTSQGDDTNKCVYQTLSGANNTGNYSATAAWYAYNINTGAGNTGTVTVKTDTGFTLNTTAYSLAGTVMWTAYSD